MGEAGWLCGDTSLAERSICAERFCGISTTRTYITSFKISLHAGWQEFVYITLIN